MYTQEQALEDIFSAKGDTLSAVMCVYKYRYKKGLLSQKTIDKILKEYNFMIAKPAMYRRENVQIHCKSDIHIAKRRQKKV